MSDDTITCPRRMTELGPWKYDEGLDRWDTLPNGDRTCSFCGSLHPEDFRKAMEEAADPDSDVMLNHSDKQYKVYVRRPDVKNATEGGIKYYKQHMPESWTGNEEIKQLFLKSLDVSQEKWAARMEEIRKKNDAGA